MPGLIDKGGDIDDLVVASGRPCTDNSDCPSGGGVELICCDSFGADDLVCFERNACSAF
jgi:hypothetical protein